MASGASRRRPDRCKDGACLLQATARESGVRGLGLQPAVPVCTLNEQCCFQVIGAFGWVWSASAPLDVYNDTLARNGTMGVRTHHTRSKQPPRPFAYQLLNRQCWQLTGIGINERTLHGRKTRNQAQHWRIEYVTTRREAANMEWSRHVTREQWKGSRGGFTPGVACQRVCRNFSAALLGIVLTWLTGKMRGRLKLLERLASFRWPRQPRFADASSFPECTSRGNQFL